MEEINESLYLKVLNFDDTKRKEWMANRNAYAVLFELTAKCNFNCIHCYLQNCHKATDLSTSRIKKILDILYDKGILFLTLTGGEIFTRKDFLEIYIYAKKKGFLVELFTNGYLLNDDIISVLAEYPPILVSISIYGSNNETYKKITGISGAYDKVIENCIKLKAAGIRTALKSPILTYTVDEMENMKKTAEEIGLKIVYSFEIHGTTDGSDIPINYQAGLSEALRYEFNDYFSKGKKTFIEDINISTDALQRDKYVYTCNVAMNSFVIDYTGNMLPCMKLRHKGKSIFEYDYDTIWEKFAIYKKQIASCNYVCKKCDSIYFCDICPAEMDYRYGDAEHRECRDCKAAKIRKAFYCEEIDYDEAIRLADL